MNRSLVIASALMALLASFTSAFSQGSVLQGGSRTSGHTPMYVGSGSSGQTIIQDSGPASGGAVGLGLSELLMTKRGTGTPPYANGGTGPLGTTNCMYDAPTTNATGYHYLCMDPNAQGGGLILYGSAGAAATQALNFCVNGTCYSAGTAYLVVGTSPISGGTNKGILYNNNGVLGNTDSTSGAADLITSGKFSITTPTHTLTQNLVTSFSSPTTGSVLGPFFANTHTCTWEMTLSGGGGAGGPETMQCLRSELYVGVAVYQSVAAVAGVAHLTIDNSAVGDVTGVGGFAEILASTNSKAYGITGGARCGDGTGGRYCVTSAILGQENDMFLEGSGIASYLIGYNSLTFATKAATTASVAYAITTGGGGIFPWTWGLLFSDRDFGTGGATNPAIASTGNAIHFDYTGTLANLINAPNITVTGSAFKSVNVDITGAGIANFGGASSAGGIGILGAGGDLLPLRYVFAGVEKFAAGATATTFFITKSGAGTAALNVDFTTNLLSAPSGLAVTGAFTASAALVLGTYLQTGAVAVASLPSCAAGTKGARDFVTDSNAASFTAGIGAVVAAGGTTNVPVTCDGTNWRIGANDNIPVSQMRKFA